MGRSQTFVIDAADRVPSRRAAVWPLRRAADVVVSLLGLVLAGPLIAVLALLVRSTSHGPAFHRERHTRADGRTVELISLRTMVDGGATQAHARFSAIIGGPSTTPTGLLLSRMRVDKLPRLANVLKGDSSLFSARV